MTQGKETAKTQAEEAIAAAKRLYPTIKIGKFTIRRHDKDSVWIMHEDGTGGPFPNDLFEAALQLIFATHF